MVSIPRWGGLRIEPYDPSPRDADLDQIVQEGTAWERPAGTRLLDELGRPIIKGATSAYHIRGISYIDRNGKTVLYRPSTIDDIQAGTPALQRLGYPSLTVMGHESVGQRAANAHISELGAVASSEYDALEAAGAFETKLENIPDEAVFVEGARGPLPYDLTDLGNPRGADQSYLAKERVRSRVTSKAERRKSQRDSARRVINKLWAGKVGVMRDLGELDEPSVTQLPSHPQMTVAEGGSTIRRLGVPVAEWIANRGSRRALEVNELNQVIHRGKDGQILTRRQILAQMLKNRGVESFDELSDLIGAEAESLMVRQALHDVGEDTLISIPLHSLSGIVDKGRYGSYFSLAAEEKIGGGGAGQPRAKFEYDVFGVDESDTDAAHRPVYGHAASRTVGENVDEMIAAGAYGQGSINGQKWHLVLKASTKDRTTYTLGDSLNDVLKPVPESLIDDSDRGIEELANAGYSAVTEFQISRLIADEMERAINDLTGENGDLSDVMIEALGLTGYSLNRASSVDDVDRMAASPWERVDAAQRRYTEAQIHGQVLLEDIEAVIVPDGARGDEISEEDLAKLRASGIKVIRSSAYGTVKKEMDEDLVSAADLAERADFQTVVSSAPYASDGTLEHRLKVLRESIKAREEAGQRTRLLNMHLDEVSVMQGSSVLRSVTSSDAWYSASAEEKKVIIENAIQYQQQIGGNARSLTAYLGSMPKSTPSLGAEADDEEDLGY